MILFFIDLLLDLILWYNIEYYKINFVNTSCNKRIIFLIWKRNVNYLIYQLLAIKN